MKKNFVKIQRSIVNNIKSRLLEPRKFIQVVTGPRQTGKSTAIEQALEVVGLPYRLVSADLEATSTGHWLEEQWVQARNLITSKQTCAILVVDEVQNIAQWSSWVKKLWDEDARSGIDLRVLLSGSSSLLLQKGLSESLMGRYELIRSTHWSFAEMSHAFGYSLEDFLIYGGYPGAAAFKGDIERWRNYINDAVVEATLSKDILQLEDVRKPAVLRRLFYLGCQFSAQELSYRKILGQLTDKGNTETMAHYLELLGNAGLLCGLQKYYSKLLSMRKSTPRFMVFDTSLLSATTAQSIDSILTTPDKYGRLIESAVGAYLLSRSGSERFELLWWRDGNYEVDFVIKRNEELVAIEVKSGRKKGSAGLIEFKKRFPAANTFIVGDENISVADFLLGKLNLRLVP